MKNCGKHAPTASIDRRALWRSAHLGIWSLVLALDGNAFVPAEIGRVVALIESLLYRCKGCFAVERSSVNRCPTLYTACLFQSQRTFGPICSRGGVLKFCKHLRSRPRLPLEW